MTTYYVSSEIGSNNNAGTSATAPLATLQAAANLVKPGDTVEVMNGTYTGNAPGGGDVVDITTSGTASAPITFVAAPGQTPVINSSGGWNAINIEASYIVVSGFTIVGDAANYTLAQALAGYSSGNPNLDGNGIAVTSPGNGVVPNHITIENNTIYDEPGAGLYTQGADYLQILNNVVYDNAHWSAWGTSGISIGISANSDTNAGVHDIISGNLIYGNAQLVPTTGGNTITDGEGIILDTNPGYVGEILVENNTVYGNGSSGIESFDTNNAVITSNTVYGNDTGNVQAASDAQIFINQSNNNTVTNNTTTAPNLTPPAAPVISGDTVGFDNTVTLNGTAEAGSTVTVFDNSTNLGTAVANTSGAWMFTTAALANGSQSFTATQTDSVGNVSPLSSALVMTLNAPVNLVANGNFATGDFTDWTLGGNDSNTNSAQVYIDTNAEGGSTYAAGLGSMGADGTLSQTIATTAGQTYTLSFWLQNEASGTNDFKAIWNGQTQLSLTNAAQFGYTEYTYTVTATSSTTTLEFSAANGPSNWDLDNISLTANGTSTTTPPAAPVISSGVANSNESVTLTGTAPAGSTVTVSDGGATALGTATANSTTGAWSYTTAALSAGSYAFTATDTTSAGTSAASSAFDVTVTPPRPAVPVISTGVANSNESVTLTGTAPAGSTVTVSDGGATALGSATANSTTGAWSYTTADLSAGSYAFTATDTTSAGTSAASSAFDVTVTSSSPPPSGPTVSSIVDSPASGDLDAGKTITLTLKMSKNVTVNTTHGTPTLTLNDGGTATYTSGSGSNALTFSYTVGAGDKNVTSLAATTINLNGATIQDGSGNAANLSLTGLTQTGPQIDTSTPTVSSIAESPSSGDLNAGKTVTYSIAMSEKVTVSGTPQLILNDGGTASYLSGTGTSTLTFVYTVATGQNTPDLQVTQVNLNGGSITDGAGNAANLSLTGVAQGSPAIDTTPPAAPVLSGDTVNANTVTLNGMAEAGSTVTVFDNSTKLGTATTNSSGAWTYTTGALANGSQSFTATATDGAGNVSAASAALAVTMVTSAGVTQVGNQYVLENSSGFDPHLQDGGAVVTAGEFAGWTPIGAVQTASGYDVAWEIPGANEYTVWSTDSNGNYLANIIGVVSGNDYALESIEKTFNQDLNGDGTIGLTKTAIQTDTNSFGSTSLMAVANEYFLSNASAGPVLQDAGAPVAVGEFGAWVPIGAVQTASGYDVAWEIPGANEYTVWSTDSNGNYLANIIGVVPGNDYALESIEKTFNQDLNGDGVVGLTGTAIQTDTNSFGSTSLMELANSEYFISTPGTDPVLQDVGAPVTVGEFGAWVPIGAVQTASGYDVAWEIPGANEYTVWSTDSNGNYLANIIGVVPGNDYALESIEKTFNQDLNGDGVVGLTGTAIQADTNSFGSTSLMELANSEYFISTPGTDPVLQDAGAPVTVGEFGAWVPIGAVQTANGYDVAWEIPGANEYTVWSTDSNGNYLANIIGVVPGNDYALESIETTFNQDLNGDGVVGLYAAPGTTLLISESLAGPSGSTSIGIGATLELQATDSASVTFQGPTGTLQLDNAPTFSGQIFNFTGNGSLSGSDQIDLRDINYNSVQDSYANGVLTVTDGSGDTAKLSFNGSYTLANFSFASDGSGGTIVYDPPVSTSDSQNTNAPPPNATSTGASGSATIGTGATLELAAADSESVASTGSKATFIADGTSLPERASNCATTVSGPGAQNVIDLPEIAFGAQTTLGYLSDSNWAGGTMSVADGTHNANIALLGNYMASSFATASDGHGGTMVAAEAAQPDQSLLSNPHHA